MSARLIYKDIAPGADTDSTVTASGVSAESNVSLLPVGVVNPEFASLELNKWGGTGRVKVHDSEAIALVSSAMSGEDCGFSSPPAVTISFGSNYTTLGVSFRFASDAEDYISSLTLAWYQGDTQLDQKTFYPNAPSYFCENTVKSFNKLVVTANATNLPGRYARIEQILFGIIREFDGYELGEVSILQQSNLISAELAISTLDWTLRNKANVNYIFQTKQPILAYNGASLLGVYYIDDQAERKADKKYQIPCTDALGVLDGDTWEAAIYSGKNAVTLLTEIVAGAFELDIDSSFATSTVTGYIPEGTRRSALQQAAFALGAIVSTSGTDKIRVIPVPSELTEIPATRTYIGGSVKTDAVVTAVVVTYHTYTTGSGSSGDDVITVGGVKYVHTTGTVRIENPDVTAADKPNVKTVTEATLVNASNAAAVAQRVYDYYKRRNTVSGKMVVLTEQPGEYVSIPTAWGDTKAGNIETMKIRLSNTTAADVTIKAVEA